MLKPQDIVVLLKLLTVGNKRPTYAQLAVDLYMSPSEVHASIRRARAARLIHGPELSDRVNARALSQYRSRRDDHRRARKSGFFDQAYGPAYR